MLVASNLRPKPLIFFRNDRERLFWKKIYTMLKRIKFLT